MNSLLGESGKVDFNEPIDSGNLNKDRFIFLRQT